MSKFLGILLTTLLIMLSATARAHPPEKCECQCVDEIEHGPTTPTGEVRGDVTIQFTRYNNKDVELVYNANSGRVSLRVPSEGVLGNTELRFLVSLVQKIVDAGDAKFPLADTGYTIAFQGGYPLWGPTTSLLHDGTFQELMFGERVELTDRTFVVFGGDEPPPFSWY
ncbi:hypothetical protein HQ524_00765 [Candidatus Uhrbacteria bacterium]|nr:hypothetical protein [Candidatus Uhrbacteria bacterium]